MLLPAVIWAQGQIAAQPSPYLDQQYPTQQFVTAEPDQPPLTVSAQSTTPDPNPPTASPQQTQQQEIPPPIPNVTGQPPYLPPPRIAQNPPPVPMPIPTPSIPPVMNSPQSTRGDSSTSPSLGQQFPVPSRIVEEPTANAQTFPPSQDPDVARSANGLASGPTSLTSDEDLFVASKKPIAIFSNGIDERSFTQCAKMAASVCSRAGTNNRYVACLNTLKSQAACQQFIAFAGLASFGSRDDIDVFQSYDEANLTLIHVRRGGTNYPGDYFVIGNKGDFVNINSGPEVQSIDITKDPKYPAFAMQHSQVQLWSLINKQPRVEPSVEGSGIRMTFLFQLRNGCATCDLIGYADVAFDFSDDGSLKRASLLGLRDTNNPS